MGRNKVGLVIGDRTVLERVCLGKRGRAGAVSRRLLRGGAR